MVNWQEKLKARIRAYQGQKYQIHSVDKEKFCILLRRGYSKRGISVGIDRETGITIVKEIRF